jgi:hypothetical protein
MAEVLVQGRQSTGTGRHVFVEVAANVQNGVIVAPGGGAAVVVVNKGVSTLAKDALVYVSGVTDGVFEVQLADANGDDLVAQFFLPAALLVGQTGLAYAAGLSVATLNTNAGNVDDPVYLSETAGGWTLTPPTAAGSRVERVGRVAVKSATVGQIMWSIGAGLGSIGTAELQDLGVTNDKLAADAVDGAKIEDDAVDSEHIAAGAIDPEHFAAQSVETAAIDDGAVTSVKLADGAGVAALLTAGLGGSGSVLKTDTLTHTLVAAHGTKARACIVMVVVDETYAVGTGTLPDLVIGEADDTDAAMATGTLDTEAAGTVLFFAFTNTATKAITATSTAAIGNATGGCSITVLAIPTT